MKTIQFERGTLNRIRIHVLPTDQFKTFAISLYIGQQLDEKKVTPTALIPFVLRRGTESLPETRQFREKLDDLYGAGFGFDVYKRGDYQIVQFRMDIIQDRYVSEKQSLLRQGLQFIAEAVDKPALDNGAFVTKYVNSEKDTIQKRIESIVNDKIRYAAERCMEEMCKNEPYRLYPLGRIEDLPAITPQSLYESYTTLLTTAPLDLYVVGNTNLEEVKSILQEILNLNAGTPESYSMQPAKSGEGEPKVVVEKLDVNQGKLNMGLRTPILHKSAEYPAMLMYNGILGGYPHSKLFINVREKNSLAYYASSRYDGHKGILTIQSGIELDNYEKASDIIKQQLESMRKGEYSETELSQTKAMLRNQLKEMQDSAFEIIAYDFNRVLTGADRSAEELINAIEQTSPSEIQKAAETVHLDTIYFLRDRKGE